MFIVFFSLTSNSYAFIPGSIFGIVRSAESQEPIDNAILKTSAGRSSITVSNGAYDIEHEEGQYTLTVMAEGYEPYSTVIFIEIFKTIEINISLTPKAVNIAHPVILSVSPEQILNGENSASIQAFNITSTAELQTVEGFIIIPENPQINIHTPISALPVLTFHKISETDNYSATYHSFVTIGHYQIVIQAIDILGNKSLPLTASVIQTTGPDVFEPDNIPEQAKSVMINAEEARHHTFYEPGDKDWVKFYGIVGKNYRIEVSHLESNSRPVVELYDSDMKLLRKKNLFDSVNDGIAYMERRVIREGIYYVCLSNEYSELSMTNTGYDLWVGNPEGALPGVIYGQITDIYCNPLEDIIIKTADNSCISNSNGIYAIKYPETGINSLLFESFFYEGITTSVKVGELTEIRIDIQMEKQDYQLSDAIKALQILSGFEINSDCLSNITIGLDNVMYILRSLLY